MDARPIGVFDSGIGGLTVLRACQRRLPHEDFLYFGDTARAPYGNKSAAAVRVYAREIAAFLAASDVKAIVIACNTASAVAIDEVHKAAPDLPVLDVITPLVSDAAALAEARRVDRIGVVATRRTVESQAYERAMAATKSHHVTVSAIACPFFVELVEEGVWDGALVSETTAFYLKPWVDTPPPIVLLGCTHFPLLKAAIHARIPSSTLLDSGPPLAERLAQTLVQRDQMNERRDEGLTSFVCTDTVESFQVLARRFLDRSVDRIVRHDWR